VKIVLEFCNEIEMNDYILKKAAEIKGEEYDSSFTDIVVLDLTVKSRNLLKKAKIYSVEQLMEVSPTILYDIEGMGKRSLYDIHESLMKFGKEWKYKDSFRRAFN